MKPKILQIIGQIHTKSENADLGSVKDMSARRKFFEKHRIQMEIISVTGRNDKRCLAQLKSLDLTSFTHVLFEYNRYPKSQKWIKSTFPDIVIMVRAHNAEFPHAVDKARAIFRNRFFMSRKAKINALCVALLRSVKTLCLDFKTARSSDHLLSCSLFDTETYWNRICWPRKAVTVGTYSTMDIGMGLAKKPLTKRRNRVCLMGGVLRSEFNDFSYIQFLQHVASQPTALKPTFELMYSGDYGVPEFLEFSHVRKLDISLSLPELMNSFDILVICGDFGRGIKTKILDAMACGKLVIVGPKVWQRLDPTLRPCCAFYDGTNADFWRQLEMLRTSDQYGSEQSIASHNEYRSRYRKAFLELIQK